ncbi:error-prone DNA polymerase domain protein [Burkholderia mallei]|nr:error-prone DNA polymerase domain protein [Burkholderia mallei]
MRRPTSMEFAALGTQARDQRRQILEILRDEMPDVALALPDARYREQLRIERLAPLPLEQFRPHDHVHAPRLVLERDEQHALRRARHLPRGHEPARAREPAVAAVAQRRGGR